MPLIIKMDSPFDKDGKIHSAYLGLLITLTYLTTPTTFTVSGQNYSAGDIDAIVGQPLEIRDSPIVHIHDHTLKSMQYMYISISSYGIHPQLSICDYYVGHSLIKVNHQLGKTTHYFLCYMHSSRVMRKPAFSICEIKGAD